MECNKWDENGLLFMARELSQPLALEFEKHLISCQSCSSELNQYTLEKKQFYTATILCESTPEHLDKKILSLYSKPMVLTSIGLFSMPWIRRAVFSALVFALGVGAGGYFSFAYYQSKTSSAYAHAKSTSTSQPAATAQVSSPAAAPDLALDSAQKGIPSFSKKGEKALPAKTAPQGIITVDLKKE
jgi:hypothetical protein